MKELQLKAFGLAAGLLGAFWVGLLVATESDRVYRREKDIREEAYKKGTEYGKWSILYDIDMHTRWSSGEKFEYIVPDHYNDDTMKRYTFFAKQIDKK